MDLLRDRNLKPLRYHCEDVVEFIDLTVEHVGDNCVDCVISLKCGSDVRTVWSFADIHRKVVRLYG